MFRQITTVDIEKALLDLTDGVAEWDLAAMTGLSDSRCHEIMQIVYAVREGNPVIRVEKEIG